MKNKTKQFLVTYQKKSLFVSFISVQLVSFLFGNWLSLIQYSSPCCLCTWTILQWVTALCLALPTLYLLYFPSGTRTTGPKIPERMGLYLGYLFVTTSSSLLSTDQASINVCSCGIFTLSFVTDGLLVLSFFWATRTQLSNYHRLPRTHS